MFAFMYMWWFWFAFVLLFSVPVGYGWGYRGWGAPYPTYIQRRRMRYAANTSTSAAFDHEAWGTRRRPHLGTDALRRRLFRRPVLVALNFAAAALRPSSGVSARLRILGAGRSHRCSISSS